MGGGIRVGSDGTGGADDLAYLDEMPPRAPMSPTMELPSMPGEDPAEIWARIQAQQPGAPGYPSPMEQALGEMRSPNDPGIRRRYGSTPGTSVTVTQQDLRPQRAPTMRMPPTQVTGTSREAQALGPSATTSRQQQAMNLAKMLGFQVEDTPENQEVVFRAFSKLTRGMPVAQLLNPKNRERVTQIFNQLMGQEAQRTRPQPPQMGTSRPPLQPS